VAVPEVSRFEEAASPVEPSASLAAGPAAEASPPSAAVPPAVAGEAPKPSFLDPHIPFPEFTVYDRDTEFVLEVDDQDDAPREAIDFRRVNVPRWALYAQGVLLGVVAMAGFGLGVVVGGAVPRGGESPAAAGPVTLTGSVAYDAGDNLPTPDEGAAVLLVPEDARPEQKAAVASLRPGSAPVEANDPAVTSLREIGGDYARTDRDGRFRLVAAQPGAYFLLIISAHKDRPEQERFTPQHLAELGRYVESAPELLGPNRYQWTRRRLDADEETSHVFR
jgi:hypothetical protein